MSDASRAPRVTSHATRVLEKSGIWQNPYLRSLQDGSMNLDQFRRSQEQFFFAVTFFPRPMAALVGKIPNPKARIDILHNLVEEHGEFNEERFHHSTFQSFLRSIGSDPQKIENGPLCPPVRAFNSSIAVPGSTTSTSALPSRSWSGAACTFGRHAACPSLKGRCQVMREPGCATATS